MPSYIYKQKYTSLQRDFLLSYSGQTVNTGIHFRDCHGPMEEEQEHVTTRSLYCISWLPRYGRGGIVVQ